MCGIAGYKLNQTVGADFLNDMINSLTHRGPDSKGYYHDNPYHAGMTRLSINDIQGGNQPLFNEDKSIALIYNGEIYNYPKLRKDLEKEGVKFRTSSDGEVICHLYEKFGLNLFEQLDGMFAVALWIRKDRKLILARDLPGEKPLYYSKISPNEIVFASEIKSISRCPLVNLDLNYQAIWDFPTFLWIPEPDTIYKNIKALLPGQILIASEEGIELQFYRNIFNLGSIEEFDEAGLVRETRRVVEESITSRLLSDVPLGSFLSSGLDSSIVTAIASKHLSSLDTFTIGFENLADPYHGKADESVYAAQFAKELGTKHHTLKVTADTFYNDLETFCQYGDQPFAVSSGLGILSISRAAKDLGIKVLLTGDGADECFGGYSWYNYLDKLNSRANEDDSKDISFQNFGKPLEYRLNNISKYSMPKTAWAWHYYASENEKRKLFAKEPFVNTSTSLRYFSEFKSKNKKWTPEEFIKQDRLFYFPFEMMRKADRMTMAFSVEGRIPFAAPAVLNHANKLKYKQMVKGGQLKWSLREAFKDLLPKHIVNRPKHGFNVPIDHWLKKEWSDLFNHSFSEKSALFANGIINQDSKKIANKMLHNSERLNGHTLFCYIMLNMWLEKNK